MKKQAVLSGLLIFLFAVILTAAGLVLTEQGLRDVGGHPEPVGALRIEKDEEQSWMLIFAGKAWKLPELPW
jgi:hypothetical protein